MFGLPTSGMGREQGFCMSEASYKRHLGIVTDLLAKAFHESWERLDLPSCCE